jgi:hypothetical protein
MCAAYKAQGVGAAWRCPTWVEHMPVTRKLVLLLTRQRALEVASHLTSGGHQPLNIPRLPVSTSGTEPGSHPSFDSFHDQATAPDKLSPSSLGLHSLCILCW